MEANKVNLPLIKDADEVADDASVLLWTERINGRIYDCLSRYIDGNRSR